MSGPNRKRRRRPPAPPSPFIGHVLYIIRTIPYRLPGWEEWSEDGGIIYECVGHAGDFLHLVPVDDDDDDLEPGWISLATIAEIRLACENTCECEDGGPDDGPPISFTLGDTPSPGGPPGDPSRN